MILTGFLLSLKFFMVIIKIVTTLGYKSASPKMGLRIGYLYLIPWRGGLKGQSLQIVYDLRAQKLSFVAPIPEQIGTSTMHFSKVSEQSMVWVLICSGMGATNSKSSGRTKFRS